MTTIARFTVLDALRSRWLWLAAGSAVLTYSSAIFAGGMALTERAQVMMATAAPLARLQAVLLMIMITAAGIVREIQERSLQLTLAAPITRCQWLLAKLAGLLLLGWFSAALAAAPLLLLHPDPALVLWTVSLGCELSLTVIVTMLFALTLRQLPAAVIVVFAFYAAARMIGVILLINERAPLELRGADQLTGMLLKTVALVLPRLDLFTRTDWLLSPQDFAIAPVLLQTMLFAALLLVVAALDLARSEL